MARLIDIGLARTGDLTVLTCRGEIDAATSAQLTQAIGAAMTPDVRAMRIDMTEVNFLDSTGLRALVVAAKQSQALGMEFSVVPSPWVERMLEVSGMRGLLGGE